MPNPKLIRITTVPISLHKLLRGQMRYMSQHYEVVAVSSPDELLSAVARNEGVRTEAVPMTREITLAKDIRALWQMFKLFRREKPQIVHTHTPKAGIVGMMAAWLARVPVRLHTIAGLPVMEAEGAKRTILLWVEKLTYFFATKVYPNSYGLMDFVLENELTKPEKLKIIAGGSSNGIDTAYFSRSHFPATGNLQKRKELGIGEDDFVFIFIGRLVKDKGINELVEAFGRVTSYGLRGSDYEVRDTPHTPNPTLQTSLYSPRPSSAGRPVAPSPRLLLVGPFEHELDPLLPDTLHEIKNNENIISVGYQDDVRPYLAIANALVFPSYREGFPNVVMQAGAMGLPSIVTDINGCNEIVVEGQNGIIIPPKDENALVKSMRYFLDNPVEVKRMAENARSMVEDRYAQAKVWEALLAEYRQLENEYKCNVSSM